MKACQLGSLVLLGTVSVVSSAQGNPTAAPSAVRGTGTLGYLPAWTGTSTVGNSSVYQNGYKVGIGTQSPWATLDVNVNDPEAIAGTTNSTESFTAGVTGHATSSAGNAYGVYGDTNTNGYGAGVIGSANAAEGTAFGGFFQAASPNGNAMFAYSSATWGQPVAVAAQIESPNGAAGRFTAHAGSGLILLGLSGPNFTDVFSVDASGNGFYAGNLTVNGTVSKSGGSFKIDHPLDPENRTLSHSFVESPDMMDVYNGVIVLDKHGEAWVELPSYFEALNRDYRYQLTSIGLPAPNLFIGREVSGNRFKIAGGKPNGKVSWQVTGIRQDAYANAHRIPVEEDKPEETRGKYLHPELFEKHDSMIVREAIQAPAIAMKSEQIR